VFRIMWAGCMVAALGISALGCGGSGNLKPASGIVKYKGQPIAGANVTFISDAGIGTGTTDDSGKYTILTNGKPGANAGMNKVTISKTSSSGSTMPANPTPEDMAKMAKSGQMPQVKAELPAKYSIPEASGLSADVGSKETFDFELTD
jgi:hypothetical protein